MNYNPKKENQFMDWVLGVEGVKFPFFKEEEMPQVEMPIRKEETEAEKMERYNKEYWRQRGTGSELQETGFPHERDSSWYPY